jgi:phosphatidylglycerophosphate synthase
MWPPCFIIPLIWPNVLTGFIIRKPNDLQQHTSLTFLFSFSLGLFLYQSLDAIDGKQARRTGTSGPLGELFDHGKQEVIKNKD